MPLPVLHLSLVTAAMEYLMTKSIQSVPYWHVDAQFLKLPAKRIFFVLVEHLAKRKSTVKLWIYTKEPVIKGMHQLKPTLA